MGKTGIGVIFRYISAGILLPPQHTSQRTPQRTPQRTSQFKIAGSFNCTLLSNFMAWCLDVGYSLLSEFLICLGIKVINTESENESLRKIKIKKEVFKNELSKQNISKTEGQRKGMKIVKNITRF
jgi:hypothetical protein